MMHYNDNSETATAFIVVIWFLMELLRYESVDSDLKRCFVTFYCFARFATQKEEVLPVQNKLNDIARNNHAWYNFF